MECACNGCGPGLAWLKGCRYNHEVPQNIDGNIQTKVGAVKNLDLVVTPSEWKCLNEVNTEQFVTDNKLVLLDSGSNEVVRSYSAWEWQQILDKKNVHKTDQSRTVSQSKHGRWDYHGR